MRVRPASSRLRFSCGVGVSVFLAGTALLLVLEPSAAADAAADAAPAPATPDDLVLDLGGGTLEARRVAHGVFSMGSAAGEAGHDKDEEPPHPVTLTKDFWIGKYPVTRGQFAKFVADTRYVTDAEKGQAGGAGWDGKPVDGGKAPNLVQRKDFTWRNPGFTQTDAHPVVLVSYGDATAFVGWATRKSGKRVRLPTEAEWEFAARAGTTTAWSGGIAAENDPASYGWFKPNAGNGTRPVGQKKPNPLGIFDMSGDVMQWCRDVYAPYHEGALVDPETTTVNGNEPERRVLRGGSWFRDPKRGRSAARYKNVPGSRMADNGFRVVITNEEAVAPVVSTPGADFVPAAPLGLGNAAGATTAPGGAGATGATGQNPSGPLADGEAIRVGAVGGSGEPFSWGLLLISPLAAASAVVAWMLLRRKRSPASARVTTASSRAGTAARAGSGARAGVGAGAGAGLVAGVSTRSGTDGFFVTAPDVVPGARVRYACIVNGTEVSDVVPLDGAKETFVYTGAPPTAIRILEIVRAPGPRGQGVGAGASAPPVPVPALQTQTQPLPPPPPAVPSRPAGSGVPVPPPSSSASVDVPVSVEVMLLPDAVQVVTEPMRMPGAPPLPGAPHAPPSVPRPPPSVPGAPPSSPLVPQLEPESISDAMSASPDAGPDAGVEVMASTDVDLSSRRDLAIASTKAPDATATAAAAPPEAPAMTAAQAFKVEPLDEEAPKPEAPKDEATRVDTHEAVIAVVANDSTEVAKIEVEETKPAEPKPEEPKPEETKPEETKPAEPKPEETKPEETKPAETKPDEPKPEETKPEEPKPDEPKPEEPKAQEPKPDDASTPQDAPKPGEPEADDASRREESPKRDTGEPGDGSPLG
jgi:sulfatase modifying factor 1